MELKISHGLILLGWGAPPAPPPPPHHYASASHNDDAYTIGRAPCLHVSLERE